MKPKQKMIFVCLSSVFLLSISANSQLSQAQIDSLVIELSKASDDTNKVKLLLNLGNEVGYTDLNKALEYAQQGYELSKKLDYEYGKASMSYLTGITYMDMGIYSMADSFLTIAEKKYIDINDRKGLGKIANARGGINYMQGNYLVAADFYTKSASEFDGIKDTALSLIAYSNLISVLGQVKNYGKAVALGKKILPVAEKRKDVLQIGYTMQSLVSDLIYMDNFDEAAIYMERMLDIANTAGDDNLAAEMYSTAGTYYYKMNDSKKAANYYETALKKAETLNNKFQLANHYNSLGQAYCRAGDFNKAKIYLLKGKEIAKEFNNKRTESNVALSLSALYDSIGDYQNAFKSLVLHSRLTDSILNVETTSYTAHLEAKYESNKKENEILRLQKVQQQKEFEIKRRNTFLTIGVVLIAALILIMYLLKRNFQNKQKIAEEKIKTMHKEQQITSLQSMINGQETERTRIAKDLHDGLGGIFSTVKMHYSTLQRETPAVKENPLYKKTLDLLNNASDELRRVAHNMMPEVLLKVGLPEALGDFCNSISSGKQLNVTLQTFGMEKRLSNSTEIMLYRIIQELVNNIVKHADATEAIIQINRDGNRLSLTIEDNGRGFDPREAEGKRTMGMDTVRSRVDYLNGRLTIESSPDVGTTVMVDIVLNEN